LTNAVKKDPYPLPTASQREAYYGNQHLSYWLSGLYAFHDVIQTSQRFNVPLRNILDLGCASGRVLRHFACQSDNFESIYGADINLKHIKWIDSHLPKSILAFHNCSLPHLPFSDHQFDMITAFSVFTHIETFDTFWLLELRRILRPGGLIYITVSSERCWEEMDEHWPVYKGLKNHPEFRKWSTKKWMDKDRLVFRWREENSYSSNVFLSYDYVNDVWGRILEIVEIRPNYPRFQDVVVLQKKSMV
jgi:ubiquinone/menaquinone biosynthesis C-methylase UbiE